MSNDIILEARQLIKDFPALRAVNNVSLQVMRGEKVFIVGPSGSGKSTFLRCLNMLEIPTAGDVIFHGNAVRHTSSSINSYRCKVGMVFQHFNLFPHLSILDNITLAPVRTGLMSSGQAKKEALALLERIVCGQKQMLIRCSFPAVRNSGLLLSGRVRCTRKYCCLMNQRPHLIRKWSARCSC